MPPEYVTASRLANAGQQIELGVAARPSTRYNASDVFLPEGDEGLWVPYPGTNRHFGQEDSMIGLADGRLLCVFRWRLGYPFYSISADRGATWTKPEVLRLSPGGRPFDQPCSTTPDSRWREPQQQGCADAR